MKPRLLDLFCGAGGAAMGYHRAGFEIVGVDIKPQPNYPFEFVEADALDVLRQWADDLEAVDVLERGYDQVGDFVGGAPVSLGGVDVEVDDDLAGHGASSVGVLLDCAKPAFRVKDFDAIHASPPCQADSAMSACRPGLSDEYPRLIGPVRALLEATELPWVIENVEGAPLARQATLDGRVHGITLCGRMFGLALYRHRLFESNLPLAQPSHPPHRIPASKAGHWRPGTIISVSGNCTPIALARQAMGIGWTNRDELAEAIPPAYTEFIGAQLLRHIRKQAA